MFPENSPWPPKPYDLVMAECEERHAWWVGDPDGLAEFYSGGRTVTATNRFAAAWQAFWGKQQTTGERPTRVHAPIAADIGRIAASTLFGDPPQILAAEADKSLQDRIDAICNNSTIHAGLLSAAESASMLSGVYGRVVWDKTVADEPWIDWVDADRAIPEFRWGRLSAVTFWSELPTDDEHVVWRHLQRYTPGRLFHSVHRGTTSNLGVTMSLADHESTQGLATRVGVQGEELPTDRLLAQYIPNMGPNAQWRNHPKLKPLGRADLDVQVMRLMDEADKVWSSWMRDLDLGKARVFISRQLLTNARSGEGASFDIDQSIFSPLEGDFFNKSELSSVMDAQQFAIRVDEHARTYEGLLRLIIGRVGYSPLTFGLSDEVAQTATETDAKTRDTAMTRTAKTRLWAPLAPLMTSMLEVDAKVFGGSRPSELVEVKWQPSKESPRVVAETINLLSQATAVSTKTKVMMKWPDWDDKQVEDEVKLIDEAGQVDVPAFGGGFGNTEPADPNADPNADPAASGNEPPTFGQ